jgi:hypothetical protein
MPKRMQSSRARTTAPGDQGRGMITRVNADGFRALRMLAAERDTTLQALAIEALNDLLAKYGKRPIVSNPHRRSYRVA